MIRFTSQKQRNRKYVLDPGREVLGRWGNTPHSFTPHPEAISGVQQRQLC
jgi:hypothetical protein